ncbi:MAG TPA: hypothetical protein PKV35_04410 [bacterium]|jgi:hypothetical protein|nr:hypothetical protein [bacterium]
MKIIIIDKTEQDGDWLRSISKEFEEKKKLKGKLKSERLKRLRMKLNMIK